MKLERIEELFNALRVVPSARIDDQQPVEPVSHNDNALVIAAFPRAMARMSRAGRTGNVSLFSLSSLALVLERPASRAMSKICSAVWPLGRPGSSHQLHP